MDIHSGADSSLPRPRYISLVPPRVEVSGKHIYFSMVDGTVHEMFGTLREVEPQLLHRQEFVRCHRAYIVNLLQVAELSATGICTFSGKMLPVSRSLYKEVQEKYMKVLFSGGEA